MGDEDDAFADREPKFSAETPMDGWCYVRVDGENLTAFELKEGEELEVYVESDKPRAAVERDD